MKILNITNIINNNVITLSDNYHKILKYQYNNYFMFYYYRETGSLHGLYMLYDIGKRLFLPDIEFGYFYQSQPKGLWLESNKP
jgi:hypothetical protein